MIFLSSIEMKIHLIYMGQPRLTCETLRNIFEKKIEKFNP